MSAEVIELLTVPDQNVRLVGPDLVDGNSSGVVNRMIDHRCDVLLPAHLVKNLVGAGLVSREPLSDFSHLALELGYCLDGVSVTILDEQSTHGTFLSLC